MPAAGEGGVVGLNCGVSAEQPGVRGSHSCAATPALRPLQYTHKRETADIVAHQLSRRGIPCRAYHAGLADAERSRVLAEWTSGEVQVG